MSATTLNILQSGTAARLAQTPFRRALPRRIAGACAWLAALVTFFPIAWMFLTSFKTEVQAITTPPLLFFTPTLGAYHEIFDRSPSYVVYAVNSIVLAFGSTLLALLLAIPCAFAMAFFPNKRTKDTLLWMLSTKMLPAVGALIPIYLLARSTGLLGTTAGLIIVDTLSNLPIVVWMLFTFFKETPKDIIEASRIDGASLWQVITVVLLPLVGPGIASTGLLSVILTWNEAFWAIQLNAAHGQPLTAFISSFSAPEGLFWAKLSAASTLAIAPIVLLGWVSQRQLVRGLTFGAVK